MRSSPLSRLVVGVALVFIPGHAAAAVTSRGAVPDDGLRPGWYDRYAEARQGPEQVERLTRSFKVGADGSLDLSGISGDVRVTGGPGAEIIVEATKRVRHRDADEARRLLSALRVDITNVGGRVEVRTDYPRRAGSSWDRGLSASVDYLVSVPATAAVVVRTVSGDVMVIAVRGEVRAETISGDVEVSATPNLVMAKTVSGNVMAKDIGGTTTLTLSTVSGSVIASGLKVRGIECGSVSGDVRLSGVQVERALAKSVSGNIEFDAPLSRGGRYEFSTHSGSVRLVLAANVGFELDANSFSGSIRSDLPVTLRTGGDRDDDRRRGSGRRAIRGSYGDGSAVLAVRTHSGSVVILRK